MLLAAGRGERMRPLTDHTPKPLLVAGGKPLIVWHIEKLAQAGIHDLVINHAHLGQQLETILGDGKQWNVQIRYSPENPALETAGGIALALPMLGDTPFAVINSDIYCDYNFVSLPVHAAHLAQKNLTAHLVLVNNPQHHPQGDFGLTHGHVTDAEPKFTFSGIGVYQPGLFAKILRGSKAPLAPLLRQQIALNQVSGEQHAGYWIDVGTQQRLQQLNDHLRHTNHA